MPWPTPQDYNEAIQNPAHCFSDPELRSGQPDLTLLGLPRPITGNFASVYRLRCGRRDWAVRCFWREYADMGQRYEAISRYLEDLKLPYTVGFQYLTQGIRVRGQWYPVLKMEWVEGQLLDEYVATHLRDRAALIALARRWREMVATLESHGVAHGDLQHGNVMVRNGDLRLVDYDAMFVPTLSGRTSHELGHQNYQHPRRSGSDFGAYLDHFSAWVIYLSLTALSVDPNLWTELNGGDERLLLKRDDLIPGAQGSGLARLVGHANPDIRCLATQVTTYLNLSPDRVPPLGVTSTIPAERGSRLRIGLSLRRRGRQPVVPGLAEHAVMPGWISEWSASPLPGFTSSQLVPWACLVASIGTAVPAAALLAFVAPGLALAAVLLCLALVTANTLVLTVSYHLQPCVRARYAVAARERKHRRALNAIARRCSHLEAQRAAQERQRDAWQAVLAARRSRIEQGKDDDLAAAGALFGARTGRVTARLHTIDEQERGEVTHRLAGLQATWVKKYLRKKSLWSAPLPTVSWWTRAKLWLLGVRTAEDVIASHAPALRRVRPSAAAAVLAWRKGIEREARATAPSSLPGPLQAPIAARFETRRKRLYGRQARAMGRNQRLCDAIREHHTRRLERLEKDAAKRLARWTEASAQSNERIAAARTEEPAHHWHMAAVKQDLDRRRGITFSAYVFFVVRTSLPNARVSAGEQGDV